MRPAVSKPSWTMPPMIEVSSAVRRGSPNGELVDQRRVAVEQGLAAALDAVGLDGGKAEHAVERPRRDRAELLRRNDAPFCVQLFLERRDEHQPRPQSPAPSAPLEPPLAFATPPERD